MAEFHFLRPLWLAAAARRRLADLAAAARPRRRRRLAQRRRRASCARTCSPSPRCCATAAGRSSRRSRLGSSRCVALAGPAWERLPVPAFRSDEALVVALDLSRSMDAGDVEPSRLARAKLKLLDLLERRAAGQTALVVFSTHAFTVTPLTTDTRTICVARERRRHRHHADAGRQLAAGLEQRRRAAAADGLARGRRPADHGLRGRGRAIVDARRASCASEGYRVSVLAVGTEQGAPIPRVRGRLRHRRERPGRRAAARRARACSGSRRPAAAGSRALAPDDRDLDALFPAPSALPLDAALDAREGGEQYEADVWLDRGLVLAVAAAAAARARASAAAGSRVWLLVLLVRRSRARDAFEWADLWQRPDQRGYEALEAEQAERAAELFENPEWRSAAQYRAGQFEESAASLANVDSTAGPLQPRQRAREGRAAAGRRSRPTIARSSSTRAMRTRATTAICCSSTSRTTREQQQRTQERARRAGPAGRLERVAKPERRAAGRRQAARRAAERAGRARRERRQPSRRRRRTPPSRAERASARRATSRAGRERRRASGRRGERRTPGPGGRRAMGVGAGRRAVAAARAAGSRRPAAPQVPVSVPAARRGPGRQSRRRRRGRGATAVVTLRRASAARSPCVRDRCAASASSQAQEPRCRRASIARRSATTSRSRYVLRAEGAVRGEPEVGAARGAVRHARTRRAAAASASSTRARPRSTSGSTSSMPKSAGDVHDSVAARRRPAIERRRACSVLRAGPERGGRGRHLHGARRRSPDVVYAQSQVLFTLRLFVGVSTGRATLTAPETTGVEAIVEKLGEDSQYQTTRGGRDVHRARAALRDVPAAGRHADDRARDVRSDGDSRSRLLARAAFSLRCARARPCSPPCAPPAALAGAAWLPAQQRHVDGAMERARRRAAGRYSAHAHASSSKAVGLLETQLPDVPLESQPGVRQYADQPELAREITAEGLTSRRSVSYAVIAQTPGEVTLAGVRLPWWNVAAQRWEVAELPPRTLRVSPSTDAAAGAARSRRACRGAAPSAAPRERSYWPWISGVLGCGVARDGRALVARAHARGARPAAAARQPNARRAKPALRKILRDLDSACAVSDAAAARDALLRLCRARFAPSPPRSLGALAALLPESVAREVLALEAHIYGAAAGRLARRRAQSAARRARKRRPRRPSPPRPSRCCRCIDKNRSRL